VEAAVVAVSGRSGVARAWAVSVASDLFNVTTRDESAATDVSLIVPTFREYTFGRLLDRLLEHLAAHPLGRTEILVVDDSDDATHAQMADVIAQRQAGLGGAISVRLIAGPRRGKGAAIREVALTARGAVVFLMDADLPVPLHHLEAFVALVRDGADVVVAERSRDRYRGDLVRNVVSRGLYLLQTSVVFGAKRFSDTQCGFKAFRREVLEQLARRQVVDGGMYDLEYLYAATLWHKKVQRVAVASNPEVRESRINVWRCLRQDPIDIARFKLRAIAGHYDGGERSVE
jgi:glycosyltransferase involved in cell wall biosynthesis